MKWVIHAYFETSNIIETRYHLSEEDAANSASYLLAGPIILYPIVSFDNPRNTFTPLIIIKCGFLVDRRKHTPIVIQLLFLSSSLTMFAYLWFSLSPTWTKTPVPAIFFFAFGQGFSPREFDQLLISTCLVLTVPIVLLVVLVPKIVSSKYISTALGAHKSVCRRLCLNLYICTQLCMHRWNKLARHYSRHCQVFC